jgi:membrane-bound ClpP family serine protease
MKALGAILLLASGLTVQAGGGVGIGTIVLGLLGLLMLCPDLLFKGGMSERK